MTKHEKQIWERLDKNHHGKGQAVTRATLSLFTGLSDRKVRQAVQTLILDYHKPICASLKTPGGYFVPATQDEVVAEYEKLEGQGKAVFARMKVLKALAPPIQMMLFP